jgi:hypothetical protein
MGMLMALLMVGLDLPCEAFNLPAQVEHLPKILYQFGNLAIVASLASPTTRLAGESSDPGQKCWL